MFEPSFLGALHFFQALFGSFSLLLSFLEAVHPLNQGNKRPLILWRHDKTWIRSKTVKANVS